MVYESLSARTSSKSAFRTVGLVLLLSVLTFRAFPAQVQAADPPHFHAVLFGTATLTTFMGYQAVRTDSTCVPSYPNCTNAAQTATNYYTYGGIDFALPDTQSILLSDLKTLSTDYYALHGGVGGGSPRFTVCLSATCNGPTDFITGYLGPPPNFVEGTSTSWENNGNLVSMTSTDARWAIGNSGLYQTYSVVFGEEELAYASNARVYDISVVTDGGWFFPCGSLPPGPQTPPPSPACPANATGDSPYLQTVFFKNIHVNNQVFFNHVACPEQGDDQDAKQQNHSELCEQKAGHGEQDDSQTQTEDPQTEQSQNQQGKDLSGEDLNTASYAGYDFTGANLQGADLSGSNLAGVNLAGADLSCADLSNANLSGANLLGAIIGGADLTGANLQGVDLSGVITVGNLVCQ